MFMLETKSIGQDGTDCNGTFRFLRCSYWSQSRCCCLNNQSFRFIEHVDPAPDFGHSWEPAHSPI